MEWSTLVTAPSYVDIGLIIREGRKDEDSSIMLTIIIERIISKSLVEKRVNAIVCRMHGHLIE